MALVVVATFLDLTEANIAAGALSAAGLHPDVADQHFGNAMWIQQLSLQGFRLAVPEGEAADAAGILAEAQARARPRRRLPERADANGWRVFAVLLMVFVSPFASWLGLAGLRRWSRGRTLLMWAVLVAVLAVIVGLDIGAQYQPTAGPLFAVLVAGIVVALIARQVRKAVENDDIERSPSPGAADRDE